MANAVGFTDGKGVTWTVVERGLDDVTEARGEPAVTWLDFETDLEVRRLWSFPDDWARLGPAQLAMLAERASTVIARFPRPTRPSADAAVTAGGRAPGRGRSQSG